MADVKYEVESNGTKVYVHRTDTGACVARLCEVSGEFEMNTAGDMITLPGCAFKTFQAECLVRYGLKISNRHKPQWAKVGFGELKEIEPL